MTWHVYNVYVVRHITIKIKSSNRYFFVFVVSSKER
jgi:hypothetical protein